MPNELPPDVAIEPEAALAIGWDDVYLREGVRVDLVVHPFGRVCRPGELPAAG